MPFNSGYVKSKDTLMINILKRQVLHQFHYRNADYFDIFVIAKTELVNLVMTQYADRFATNGLLGGSGFTHISGYGNTPIEFSPIEVPVLDIDYPDTDSEMIVASCYWKTISITGTAIGERHKFTVWADNNCYAVRHNNDYYIVTPGFVYLIRLSEGASLNHTFNYREIPIKNTQGNFEYIKDLQ